MQIMLKNGDEEKIEIEMGSSLADIFKKRKIKGALAAKVNGTLIDLSATPGEGDTVGIVTYDTPEGKGIFLHSASHLLAQALTELYPGLKLTIGPAIADGFYYDVDSPEPISENDLPAIEKRMKQIAKKNIKPRREDMSKADALKLYPNNEYKQELIEEIKGDTVSVYYQDDFFDLCNGPHIPHTGLIKSFKLTAVAGAYWRGSEHNPMLTRIYGTAYRTEEELKEHLDRIKEIKRRDHRRLGRELDLFSFGEERGAGLPYYHPNGAIIREEIETFWKKVHREWGYELVYTPHIASGKLFTISGHLDYYREHMYVFEIDDQEYVLKPMNCPLHVSIYQTAKRSYRELPIRYAELGTVYRYEPSGTLHGMLRVRGFTQDDAHIFCTPEQIEDELAGCVKLAVYLLDTFGYEDYRVDISVRDPENKDMYIGSDEDWETAERSLHNVLNNLNMEYVVEEGEAVFYGPKIDFQIFDKLGRKWQGPTIQFDFNIPERFGVKYTGSDGAEHTPFIVHRAMYGSLERFIGGLIEHYGGLFPLWLAPTQMLILPVTEKFEDYAYELKDEFVRAGIRVKVGAADEKLGARIRKGEIAKIPYLGIVGEKEAEGNTISLRGHGGKDYGAIELDSAVNRLMEEINSKATTPIE
ncbi:MAG: threonine--tRNA ligase [bacterium]|nr:threonine--tRNA ligase [bacterium]